MALKSKPLDAVRRDLPLREVSKDEIARININVPASVRRAWKQAALDRDMTVTELIEKSVHMYLNTQMSKSS